MIETEFIANPDPRQIAQIAGLYISNGWLDAGQDYTAYITRMIPGSHCFLTALAAGQIVGMGRAISDRVGDAYIQDVTVASSHRRMGIGTRIIREIAERLIADGLDWIGIVAENNTHAFYERLGFRIMPDSIPLLKKST
jgi:aralkylamine N-acetyltransferase